MRYYILSFLWPDISQILPTLLEVTSESCYCSISANAPTNSNSPLQEVRLSTSTAERDLYDSLAEIYSIIVTLDGLEKAYIKDSVTESVYTEICSRLLKQYKSNLTDETVAREFVDLETFKRTWEVRRPSLSRRCLSSAGVANDRLVNAQVAYSHAHVLSIPTNPLPTRQPTH